MPTYTPRDDDSFQHDGGLINESTDAYRGYGALRFKATCTEIQFELFTDSATARLIVDDNVNMGTLFSPANNGAYTFVAATGLDGAAEHTYQVMCASREMFLKRITINGGDINTTALASRGFNAFFGDSITIGSVLTDFGDLWVSRYSIRRKKGWRNFGLSGSKVQSGGGTGGIDRTGLITDLSPEPDAVFIHYGVNDIEAGRTDTQFEADYQTMMDALIVGLESDTLFWCMGIMPLSGGSRPTSRLAFNTKIASVVSGLGLARVRYVDTDGWFNAATQTVGGDGVHPDATANALITVALDEAVNSASGEMANDHYFVGSRAWTL